MKILTFLDQIQEGRKAQISIPTEETLWIRYIALRDRFLDYMFVLTFVVHSICQVNGRSSVLGIPATAMSSGICGSLDLNFQTFTTN